MSDFSEQLRQARAGGDPQALVDLIPYARLLGVQFEQPADPSRFRLLYRSGNIGNPHMPALHGGVIGAFMETAAMLDLMWRQDSERLPKVIDFSIDYLRPGRPEDVLVHCEMRRQGKRVANVGVTAWQETEEDSTRVIATARTHFLIGSGAAR